MYTICSIHERLEIFTPGFILIYIFCGKNVILIGSLFNSMKTVSDKTNRV